MSHLFLIGYMGVGKSTIGEMLSKHLQSPFKDLDEQIERRSDKEIPRIFQEEGESSFREKESEELQRIIEEEASIIACGGGTPCSPGNLQLMQENGSLVHLKAKPETILKRTQGSNENRPKLKGMNVKAIRDHLQEREACYDQADLEIDTDQESKEEIIERIKTFYSR